MVARNGMMMVMMMIQPIMIRYQLLLLSPNVSLEPLWDHQPNALTQIDLENAP